MRDEPKEQKLNDEREREREKQQQVIAERERDRERETEKFQQLGQSESFIVEIKGGCASHCPAARKPHCLVRDTLIGC